LSDKGKIAAGLLLDEKHTDLLVPGLPRPPLPRPRSVRRRWSSVWGRRGPRQYRAERDVRAEIGTSPIAALEELCGLDEHQVRRWTSWHRWTTLAKLTHAFLAVTTATERDRSPATAGLIALTVNEFRRLFDALLLATDHTIDTLQAWSRWRRRHQARARACHYRRRTQQ
jgi:hypothetical protein